MHTEYIVSSRNLEKKFPVPLWTKGRHLKVIKMIFSFISFCALFFYMWTMWTEIYMMFSKCKFHICNQRAHISQKEIQYEKKQIKIILTNPLSKNATKRIKQVYIVPITLKSDACWSKGVRLLCEISLFHVRKSINILKN